jgi:uncharacterized membrane protein required for colicin V production
VRFPFCGPFQESKLADEHTNGRNNSRGAADGDLIMGLDLALAGLVLVTAIRGWLKGFVVQAVRLIGLVSAVYVAAPLRDQVKPYAITYLPTIRPDLVDRLFWWVSACVSYFVLVGLASLLVSVSRRPALGIKEPNRNDQFAGLSLGVVKGLVVAAFIVASLEKYAEPHIEKIPYGASQAKESNAWDWNKRFHPAQWIWTAPPVQHFVAQIKTMGLNPPPESNSESTTSEEPAVKTASRTPKLTLSPDDISKLDTSGLSPELSQSIQDLKRELRELRGDQ